MKAIVQNHYGPPEVLALADIDPPTVGANGVLVRVHAASVNAGDRHLMTGTPKAIRAAMGTFAELVCPKEDELVAKPDELTFEQASALPSAGMTHCIASTRPGSTRARNC